MNIKDDDGGSDVEVSELSEDGGVELLYDGFEEEVEGRSVGLEKHQGKGDEVTSVKS